MNMWKFSQLTNYRFQRFRKLHNIHNWYGRTAGQPESLITQSIQGHLLDNLVCIIGFIAGWFTWDGFGFFVQGSKPFQNPSQTWGLKGGRPKVENPGRFWFFGERKGWSWKDRVLDFRALKSTFLYESTHEFRSYPPYTNFLAHEK